MPAAVDVFISYAPEDEALRVELERHLALLLRERLIEGWHPGRVGPGEERDAAIAVLRRAAQKHPEDPDIAAALASFTTPRPPG
ncbi:MAG: hypothetical protein HUU21_16065 [Polyangiaceae bacterium]|nr:hypothetical protein [Polyangiaceae bacterium]